MYRLGPSRARTFISFHLYERKVIERKISQFRDIQRTTYSKDDVVRPSLDAVTIISHTLRTRLAPRRNPCADTARLSASNSQTRSCANLSDALVERISRWPTLQSPSVSKEAQLTCLVLQLIQTLSSLRHLCDVFSHNSDCVVNLLLDGRSLGVASRRAAAGGSTTSARDIWIVRFRPGCP